MSTHTICFHGKIIKIYLFVEKSALSGAMSLLLQIKNHFIFNPQSANHNCSRQCFLFVFFSENYT